MSDPLRTDSSHALDGASESERVAKIEQLLLVGLDHYFAGQYDEAINIWTRVLFLDRSHARARAYIDRARSALGERQRKGEELLQHGIDAFNRGESATARRLLNAAVSGGADEAQAVLDRLDRLELRPSSPMPPPAQKNRPRARTAPPTAEPARPRLLVASAGVLVALAMGIGVFIALTGPTWRGLIFEHPDSVSTPPVPPSIDATLPLPRRGEISLARAKAFAATGRLRDALATLDSVRATDPEKADADRLRADVQRQLVALAAQPPVSGSASGSHARQ